MVWAVIFDGDGTPVDSVDLHARLAGCVANYDGPEHLLRDYDRSVPA